TLDSETAEWASRWPVYEWDVINETLGNHRIQDVLGEDQMAEWFRIAESSAVQTNCKLLINEYKLISGFSETLKPGYYTDRRDRYMVNIDRIIADGGPISRIGFQSRLQHEKMDPQTYYDRLEEFGSRYGLEMAGTEFEVVDRDPLVETYFPYVYTEEERAQMTEEILTSYYSHPLASGLSAWDFMEANTSSMCYYDGTVKLNGLVWYYLHRIRYTTDVTTHSSTSGHTTVRGYKGDYDVLVQFGGRDYPAALSLNSNTTLQIEVETASAVRTVDFQPVADTFAHKFKPTENFGTDPGIDLRSLSADSSRVRLGYMQFEITNIPYAIESVELHLYSNDEPDPVRFLQVTDNNWTETGLFWNNRPATGSLITTAQATSAGTRFTADLTSYITATGTWSIAIDETGDTADSLASKESANPPVLRVVYRAPDTDSDGIFDDLDTDDDGDHLPDDYEGLYGFDPLTADHNSDPDEDGMDTIFEFATGQNPIIGATNPASRGFAISSATDTLMLRLDERQGLASHNLKLVLEHSTNLTSWAVIDPLDPGSAGFTVIQRVTNTVSDAYGPIDLRLIELVPTQGHGYFRSHVETTP
ncbi:MAG: DNRLRE domain-containing protein, partial [Verrucomicrobia bacterium]|nr:DNRLRE domain-containing protein [Verrucomicrobiota bacterium]